mmetsp:Transcript_23302/g.34208  ORF Transcript_23302/g.34208 Transcript_23302/m.34208 type:complete len:80 (+) Transcript_23302:3-242(+)
MMCLLKYMCLLQLTVHLQIALSTPAQGYTSVAPNIVSTYICIYTHIETWGPGTETQENQKKIVPLSENVKNKKSHERRT